MRSPMDIEQNRPTQVTPRIHANARTGDMDSKFLDSGLSSADALERLRQFGPNQVARDKMVSPFVLLLSQFKSSVIWLLAGACIVAAALGQLIDAIAIGAIVIINAVVGFIQEFRAERALLALRGMTAPRAHVLRDGRATVIPANDVVPDDVLILSAGDIVAADARLLEANSLLLNESVLTGESLPVEKSAGLISSGAPLADRHDLVFMGTAVASGTGRAIVVSTGMKSELGKIAHLLTTAQEDETPLQKRLSRVSRVLIFICLGIVAIVATLGLLRGMPVMDVLLSGISLAVAAVPEGLPAVVTIALAIGVQRMVSRNVLVRRLPAVETLGCATVICTDKTGTLTTGVMRVRELWGPYHERLMYAACACCDAELDVHEQTGIGDPTEVALLLSGVQFQIRRSRIERENPRLITNPFDSKRKRMSVLRDDGMLYVKGAIETTLPLCITGTETAHLVNQEMAQRGLRVLAVALGQGNREQDLHLVGLVGIADPPRAEAIDAVADARAAGIRTVMITGDHPTTAQAIARELGILAPGENHEGIVHARTTPKEKLTIVRRWKDRGEIVAMTGDGVNDAPALREAHIGIAMGKNGTEVSREASDIILTDDNFASVIAGVREGRGIFDNIRKSVVYLLAGNASELAVMLGGALLGLPLPLLPLHLLWINLVTDGLPALALVTDPVDDQVMTKPPRKSDEPMLNRSQWGLIISTGLMEAGVTLGAFAWALHSRDLNDARSLAFSVLVFGELFRAFAARNPDRIFWEVGAFTNLRLLGVVISSISLQLVLSYHPWTQKLFQITALSSSDYALALGLGLIPVSILEIAKLMRRLARYGSPQEA